MTDLELLRVVLSLLNGFVAYCAVSAWLRTRDK